MIDAGPALRAVLNPDGLGVSQMNENALLRSRIPADDSHLRANWVGSSRVQQGNLQRNKQKNENSNKIH